MEGINTGLSVKERMKLFQNKPAEDVKKSEVSTGVSIKDRQASFQNKPDKPVATFVPSSSQAKVNNPESSKPVQPVSVPAPVVQTHVPVTVVAANPQPAFNPSPQPMFTPSPQIVTASKPNEPKEPISTGISIKERMAAFQQASKPKTEFQPTPKPASNPFSASKPAEKETVPSDAPLKDRLSSAFSPVSIQPVPKEEVSVQQRISLTFAPIPVVSKPEVPSPVPKPQEPVPISTGLSVKERMAALQQAAKTSNERSSTNYVPVGPSIKERMSLVQESSATHTFHKAKTEEAFSNDIKSISSRFENQGFEEPPKQRESITTGRTAGQDNEFKKKMEGMVFMPPPPGGFAMKPVSREPERARESDGTVVLVELEKPVRKRAAATFDDDFEF